VQVARGRRHAIEAFVALELEAAGIERPVAVERDQRERVVSGREQQLRHLCEAPAGDPRGALVELEHDRRSSRGDRLAIEQFVSAPPEPAADS